MHAFVLSDVILAGVVALVTALVVSWRLARWASVRWPEVSRTIAGSAVAYRDSLHRAERSPGAGQVPREVALCVAISIAQIVYLVASHVLFARTALRLDLWRVRPVAVQLVIVQSVFLAPAAFVYLRAALGLLRRDRDADGRARFTAGAYIAIRAMRAVAGLAVASEFSRGYLDGARVAYALPGFVLALVSAAAMVRAANAADARSLPSPATRSASAT